MKRALFIITGLLFVFNGNSKDRAMFIYGELGGGYGNFSTFKAAINGIYNNDYCFGIAYYGQSRRADNIPADFNPGLDYLIVQRPQQTLNTINITAGKVILTQYKMIRYLLKGGISIGYCKTPANYTESSNGYLLSSNYDVTYDSKMAVGLVLNPTVEFPFCPGFGLNLGLTCNLNTSQSYFGAEAGLIFGKTRNRSRHPIHKN